MRDPYDETEIAVTVITLRACWSGFGKRDWLNGYEVDVPAGWSSYRAFKTGWDSMKGRVMVVKGRLQEAGKAGC